MINTEINVSAYMTHTCRYMHGHIMLYYIYSLYTHMLNCLYIHSYTHYICTWISAFIGLRLNIENCLFWNFWWLNLIKKFSRSIDTLFLMWSSGNKIVAKANNTSLITLTKKSSASLTFETVCSKNKELFMISVSSSLL